MKTIYNRDLIATARVKAPIAHRSFSTHGALRILCRAVAQSACRLYSLVCVTVTLSLLATSTPAAPKAIVALTKEFGVSFRSGKSIIRNPQLAITLPSDPKVELAADLSSDTVDLTGSLRPKDERAVGDSATPIFAHSSRAAKHNTALAPQGNGYTYRRNITVNHTKVPNSDQVNFPVLISGTYSYLKTVANGGNVENSNGYDVIFTSNTSCSTKLDHEVETYNPSTGAVNYWVRVPTLSHSSDTVFYLCYGNSSISSDQSNKTAVWNSNYRGVWHLPNGTSLSTTDSTSNANHSSSNSASATSGEIDGGASYNGSSQSTVISNPGSFDFEHNQAFSVEFWLKKPLNTISNNVLISKKEVYWNGSGFNVWTWAGSNTAIFEIMVGTTGYAIGSGVNVQDNAWHQIVGTYDGTSNRSGMRMYVDGVLRSTGSSAAITSTIRNTYNLTLGTNSGSSADYFNGSLDEVRVSNSARSADWIQTQFNNQSAPADFYTISPVGGETGSVQSVFGRTGVVQAETGDYTWAQINKDMSSLHDITTRSAGDLSSGTLPDGRFPAVLPGVSGANLTALNASNLTSGTVAPARLGSGATSNNFLRGDNTWAAPNGESQWTTAGSNIHYNTGNVGIGTPNPGQKLSVAGTIESTTGGFKFPDGTTQSTAAGGGGGQVFNVKAYGALGDGTTDDHTAFVAANTAAAVGGGTILVPASSTAYIIGSTFTLSANVSLKGAGIGVSTIKRKSTLTATSVLRTGNNSVVSDLTFDGDFPARSTGFASEIGILGNDTLIERIEIKNAWDIGIDMANVTNARIQNSIFNGSGVTSESGYAIWMAATGIIRPVVTNNRFTNWSVAGIYAGATEGLVQGNYFVGNHAQTTPTGGGQLASGATGRTTAIGNYFGVGGGSVTTGIEADSGPWTIIGNTVVGQQGYGIILQNAGPAANQGHFLANNNVSGSGISDFLSQIAIADWKGINNTPAAANNWIQSEGLLSTTAAVNLNTATATTLYTCPPAAGTTCVITKVVIRNASTSLTTASISFGWNSAAFDNVIANATHTELTGSTLYTVLNAKVGAAVGAAEGVFKVQANTLQGATATIDVFGYQF
ncbi:MAG: DUF2341 domain-containing protein [Acidobacteriota bacterium]